MEKIKWGIIGPGNIANNFADGLKDSYSGQLVSIASKNEDRRKTFGDKYDIHPDFRFDNYSRKLNFEVEKVGANTLKILFNRVDGLQELKDFTKLILPSI